MIINYSGPEDLLNMHDLLQGMARSIQERGDNNRRLRLSIDALRALSRDRARAVNLLECTGENGRELVSLHKMPSLRYLVVQNAIVMGNIGNLAPNLLWIKIRNCELRNGFQLDSSWSQVRNLSVEQCASLTRIPNTLDSLVNLRCLYLEDCVALTTLPNILGNLSQLKELHLRKCTSLTSLPDTVGNLMQLEKLKLEYCTGLRSLPSSVGNLAQLEVMYLNGCTGLRNLPNTIGDLPRLRSLYMDGCSGLQSLPYAVGKLQNLRLLFMRDCFGDCGDFESFHDWVAKLAQLRGLNRSPGIRRLVQKKFDVCVVCHAADEEEALRGNKYKYLRSGSSRICTVSEDEESSDVRKAIDISDILVPLLSESFLESTMCTRMFRAMWWSNSPVIPLFLSSYIYTDLEFRDRLFSEL